MFSFRFSFRRKNPNLSVSLPSTGDMAPGAIPGITPGMVPGITPPITPSSTAEFTAAIASTIASSCTISQWVAGPKPFPAREHRPGGAMQIWPAEVMPLLMKHPTAKQIAEELFAALQKHCAGQWVLAQSIAIVVYPEVCHQLGWPMRPWKGPNGVAAHLAKLSPIPPKYIRVEIVDGEVSKLMHYWISEPQAQTATVVPIRG